MSMIVDINVGDRNHTITVIKTLYPYLGWVSLKI